MLVKWFYQIFKYRGLGLYKWYAFTRFKKNIFLQYQWYSVHKNVTKIVSTLLIMRQNEFSLFNDNCLSWWYAFTTFLRNLVFLQFAMTLTSEPKNVNKKCIATASKASQLSSLNFVIISLSLSCNLWYGLGGISVVYVI